MLKNLLSGALLPAFLVVTAPTLIFSQTSGNPPLPPNQPVQIRPARFGITEPVSVLAARQQMAPPAPTRSRRAPVRAPLRPAWRAASPVSKSTVKAMSLSGATETFLGTMAPPLLTFEGIGMIDNEDVFEAGYYPSDSNGDIGPNHYVEMVNTLYRVYDRQGNPLTPPLKLSALFQVLGGPASEYDDGDPIVLYDHLADRWLLSQFVVSGWFEGERAHQAIAISQTDDPTGAYYVYDFEMPNDDMNDYPKFGVWPQAYFMTDNQFSRTDDFTGAGVFAFDRRRMLVGDPTASYCFQELPDKASLLPADLDGPPPSEDSPGIFVALSSPELENYRPSEEKNSLSGLTADVEPPTATQPYGLQIFFYSVDFEHPERSDFSEGGLVALPPFVLFTTNMEAVAQRGTRSKLDSLGDRLMHRLQYRCYGEQDGLVGNFTENVGGTGQAGVHYFDLRRYLPDGEFFVHEQGLQAPDRLHRWMGSAATDWQGNLAVGYSASGIDSFPSIRYAGRLAGHPPGRLTLEEAVLQAGVHSQDGDPGRWGDYSMLAVDLVDDSTFWYVNQYIGENPPAWNTRIGSFRFTNSIPAPNASVFFTVIDADSGEPVESAVVQSRNGYWRQTEGTNGCLISLTPGTHTFFASAGSYLPSADVEIVLTNSQTASQEILIHHKSLDFSIVKDLAAEFSGPWGGPFDPESVSFTITNSGTSCLVWTSYWNHAWMAAVPSGGSLPPGESIGVTLKTTGPAASMPPGSYADTLVFTSLAGSQYYTIPVRLLVTNARAALAFNSGYQALVNTHSFVEVDVLRSLGTNGVAWVDYTTIEASAKDGVDYRTAQGTLFFPSGITRQTIRIELLPVTHAPSKAFRVSLSNPQGDASLGSIHRSTIHLLEDRNLVYREFLDQDPQWDMAEGWEYGKPEASRSALTGTNVLGFFLGEDYPNNLAEPSCLTSTTIDCSRFQNLRVQFYRRLNIERSLSDHATVELSTNGIDWIHLWTNPSLSVLSDSDWTLASYDLTSAADRSSTVYLRWSLGPTDSSVSFKGWRIDDIEVYGEPVPFQAITVLPVLTNRWEIEHVRILDKDTNSMIVNANELYLADLRPLFPEIKTVYDLIGKSDYYFYPTHLAEKYRADDQTVIQAGVPWETIEENQPEGGVKNYVYVSKTPLRDQDGIIFALRILFYPIPGRPDTTLPVFTNEWVAAHAIVIDKDTNSLFINANEPFLKTLRPTFPDIMTVTNLIGKDDFYFYSEAMAEKFRADDQRVLASGTNWVTVEENQPLGGQKTYMHVTKYPLRGATNQILGLRIVAFAVPALNVQPAQTGIELSWLLEYAPFVLQHSENCGPPWNDVNGASFITNGMIRTIAPNATGQEFYRLRMEVGSW
jgi:hypothetical protein